MSSGTVGATRAIATTYNDMEDRGINSANVENAKAKFEDYKTAISTAFEEFKSGITKYNTAFFGEQQASIKSYVDKVMDAAAGMLYQLDQFGPQLDEAAAKYASQDSTISGELTGTN